MSGSVTPSRRPHSHGYEAEDVYGHGESGSAHSRSSKRPRMDTADNSPQSDELDTSESPEGAPLPDSYRRSPRGDRNTAHTMTNMPGNHVVSQKHQPGSIVRVTLKNFVTYTHAEFFPGPNLNMIIGPNGTGKSTLVCAICLGLGWNTSHLGRAKDISEFIKHGSKQATVEIELAADPERHQTNPVITSRISKESGKSDFFINGRKSSKKGAQELARSFNIQVDNLCQFLPQDRVVEFAALNPIDLLAQTQRAAAPDYMSEWHEHLKVKRKDEKTMQVEQQAGLDQLKSMQDRQKSQEGEVGRLRERTVLQQREGALHKLRPFTDYNFCKRTHLEAKAKKKAARKELDKLERQIEPKRQLVEAKTTYHEGLLNAAERRRRVLTMAETDADEKLKKSQHSGAEMDKLVREIEAERKNGKQAMQSIPRLENDIQRIQRAIDTPPVPFDPADFNQRLRELTQRIRELEARGNDNSDKIHGLREQARQRADLVDQYEGEKLSLQSQVGRQTNKLMSTSKDAATAWHWIQDNQDRFAKKVYGPAMIECSVKDPRHADAVEAVVGASELMAFTVTSEDDFKMLQNQLYTVMKLSNVNIRSSIQPLSQFSPPYSQDDVRQLGLDCFVVDMIDGPDAVLAMLCDNRNVHQTGYTSRDKMSDIQLQRLERSTLSAWVRAGTSYNITRRREYGDAGVSTRSVPVKQARLLTDAPVDTQEEQRISTQLNQVNSEILEIKTHMDELSSAQRSLEDEIKQLKDNKTATQEEKDQKQQHQTEYNGLSVKRQNIELKLDDARTKVNAYKTLIMGKINELDDLCLTKGQHALDHARALDGLRSLHEQLFETEIMGIEAKSDLEQLHACHEEENRQLDARKLELEQATQAQAEAFAAGQTLTGVCVELGAGLTGSEDAIHQEIAAWEPAQLDNEILSVQAQLESLHGGNDNLIREYEQRARKIENRQEKLTELETSLTQIQSEIQDVRGKWEPELDHLVGQISEAFAENLSRIQCAGEVAVYKDDDFDLWAIQIKVKFRENEELSVLDSHRQSGGERAVSTIFYLMALQSLARAPFRVVDEINQGMDPRNERLVHSRMVAIACAEHTSQYFLITPKLLNGLDYHPNMKVHCIASGEYMPKDHRELDFRMLAQKALAVRSKALTSAAS